jgi:threonine-phosphate decarboxylase
MGNSKVNLKTDNLLVQKETVRFDLNMNPLGVPTTVNKAICQGVSALSEYPDTSYKRLRESISDYCGADTDNILVGSCSYEFIKLIIELNSPKKALLITPGAQNYENLLKLNGCEISYYQLSEEEDFILDIADYIAALSEELDIVFISNPNAATSGVIDRESLEFIAKICAGNDICMVVDEEYMDFAKDIEENTAIPLVPEYENLVVLRNTSKFFAVPGLRLSYAITSNLVYKKTLEIAGFPYPINKLAEVAGIEMLHDKSYISESASIINTERNLVYSALKGQKSIRLFKPSANFILIKLLKADLYAREVRDYCINKGLYIRDCTDITGLGEKFIRFAFMNPGQDDLLVNTILEIV